MSDSRNVPSADDLFDAAVQAVLQSQDARVSRLQRDLHLDYGAATTLVDRLKMSGVLLPDWPGRESDLHPDYQNVRLRGVCADEANVYTRRVANLAIFYWEMAEQDNNAHSDLVKMMLPSKMPASLWGEVQDFFRRGCCGARAMTMTDAALEFHAWALERGLAPTQHFDFAAAIRAVCLPYERPFVRLTDPTVMLERAYVRLARFFLQAATDDLQVHSRISAFFIQNNQIPQSVKSPGCDHGEHVVPCAVQREIACEMFREGHSVYNVAQLLKKLHVLIWVDGAAQKVLDSGPGHLKFRMPAGWRPESGCIYARLHAKQIPFEPPPSNPCICGTLVHLNQASLACS